MSRDASIILTFLDGEEYKFRLAWGQLIKLQEARDCGPFVVLERLLGDDWRLADVREVLRLGLVGGGVDEVEARKLVREEVETRPPADVLALARDVFMAAVGPPEDDEPPPKKAAAARRWTTYQMVAFGSPPSMA